MFKSKIINWTLGIFAGLIVLGVLLPKPQESPKAVSAFTAVSPSVEVKVPEASSVVVPKEPETHWTYQNDQDDMGRKRSFAFNSSINTLDFKFPYSGQQHAQLAIRKNTSGLDVIFSVEKGQFICDISDGCTLNVKFDDGPITHYSASGSTDHSTTVLFLGSEARFVASLKKAKEVRIEATWYQEGSKTLIFNVEGLKWE